jgi:uncharacterized tellurite resistance protein B-like protein
MVYREPELSFRNLDETEALAFAVLVRAVIAADGRLDDEERDALQQLAVEYGEEAFWALMDRAAEAMNGPEAVQALASRVQRTEARELIYGVLVDVAIAGAIDPREQAILDWLVQAWGIDVEDDAG